MMGLTKTPSWRRETGFGVLAIAAVGSASVAAQIATYPNLAPWYAGLLNRHSILQTGSLRRFGRSSMR